MFQNTMFDFSYTSIPIGSQQPKHPEMFDTEQNKTLCSRKLMVEQPEAIAKGVSKPQAERK